MQISPLSADEYLEGEQRSDIRHEYVAGEVHAMAGAGERHNRISLNIAFHLRSATRGTRCGAFMSDMKVRVAAADAFYYPDALLTCDAGDDAQLYKVAPCLIAEVLSPATEVIDRREKLIAYRTLEALRYYLLAAQDARRVELYERQDDGSWVHTIYEGDGDLEFRCGGLTIRFSLAEVYEDVVFAQGNGG
ncbi:Protein of unknown function DUF820 [Thioalkalivibrio nitratireducens DSM 14787]|uniref:Putative restriction endonuclease domain-containing protein n=1 Tax=Thioalkalivibrio nitratireducens (strain DSM 14787 / UNIQEM 213 / ALEN2) TaxID=1255043 RepID=L0DS02_THIND|nr:Uma2 family endonuclease [Thioalkalivibrio nitratireducens]AGA31767.1 Protein of unknown function DUF820 [Thioalkalivibrio nitratireducens DSM 14787]